MASTLIKPERDVDWYVMWESTVEFPVAWGPREEIKEKLRAIGHDPALFHPRFDRADRNGSSALWPGGDRPLAYGWEARAEAERSVIVEQKGTLRLDQFPAFCAAVDADGDWEALLEPLERD